MIVDRRPGLAEVGIGDAEIAERIALAAPVADLARDDQGLLIIVDRRPGLAKVLIGEAGIAEPIALAAPVAGRVAALERRLAPGLSLRADAVKTLAPALA